MRLLPQYRTAQLSKADKSKDPVQQPLNPNWVSIFLIFFGPLLKKKKKAHEAIFIISKENITTEAHLKSTEIEVQISPLSRYSTSLFIFLKSRNQLRRCWNLSHCKFIHYVIKDALLRVYLHNTGNSQVGQRELFSSDLLHVIRFPERCLKQVSDRTIITHQCHLVVHYLPGYFCPTTKTVSKTH